MDNFREGNYYTIRVALTPEHVISGCVVRQNEHYVVVVRADVATPNNRQGVKLSPEREVIIPHRLIQLAISGQEPVVVVSDE